MEAVNARVEWKFLYNGEWGTVCDDLWGLEDANVVCRQLGYPGADEAPQSARFGEGLDPNLLDDVQCVGTEASLNDCPKNDIGQHNCGHIEFGFCGSCQCSTHACDQVTLNIRNNMFRSTNLADKYN